MAASSKQELQEKLKPLCEHNQPENSDMVDIYKIPVHKETIRDGVFKCNIFSTPNDHVKDEKVILVLGVTGGGKTSLINRMINYIFGVNYTDTFRFQLIDEPGTSHTKSKTKHINKYTIHNTTYPYTLTIIDTPGIYSTEGKAEDNETLEKIRYLFESGTVDAVDAICIVEKYTTNRLTENQMYIYRTIAETFGKDVAEVVAIMTTFCDDIYEEGEIPKKPKAIAAFKEQELPCETFYVFNNKDIYENPKTKTNTNELRALTEKAFWNTSTYSFTRFFERLDTTSPISLKLTREILRKRYNIKQIQLPYLIRELKINIHEIDTIEKDRVIIQEMIENPDTSEFIVEVEVTKPVLVDITEPNVFSTRCKTCDVICHYPCDIQESNLIQKSTRWCHAMTWFTLEFNIHCTVCPDRCNWQNHEQIKKKVTFETRKENRTNMSLKESYMKDMQAELESVKKRCEAKMLEAYKKVKKDFKDIQNGIAFINKYTLSRNPTNIQEYVDAVILKEEQSKRDGYKQRIHCLRKLVQMKDEDSSLDDVQQAIAFIQEVQSTKNM